MFKTTLTVGLFDKDAEVQLVSVDAAKAIISHTLIDEAGLFAFTMWECNGVYRMNSTGNIVYEPSIRIEIVTDAELKELDTIVSGLKIRLNQESIMIEKTAAAVSFN